MSVVKLGCDLSRTSGNLVERPLLLNLRLNLRNEPTRMAD